MQGIQTVIKQAMSDTIYIVSKKTNKKKLPLCNFVNKLYFNKKKFPYGVSDIRYLIKKAKTI